MNHELQLQQVVSASTVENDEQSVDVNKCPPAANSNVATSSGSSVPHLHHQIRNFKIELSEKNQVFTSLFGIQCPNRVITFLLLFSSLLFMLDYLINDTYLRSLTYGIILRSFWFITGIIYLFKCNCYIIKQALQSFLVWYKCCHIFIAMFARQVYFNFWIPTTDDHKSFYSDIPSTNSNNLVYYYIYGTLFCFDFFIAVLALSCSDGLKTKTQYIKRLSEFILIILLIWYWIEVYFNFGNESFITDKYKSFTINIFNRKHNYYWRSIALSSTFKTLIFASKQLYLNVKKPNKLNVVPLPVTIKREKDIDVIHGTYQNYGHSYTVNESTNHQFSIDMPVHLTVFYFILVEKCKINEQKALQYSQFLFKDAVFLTCAILIGIPLLLKGILFKLTPAWILITMDMIVLVCATIVFLNVNYKLLHYRKESFLIKWKLYNVVVFYIALYLLRYRHGLDQFSKDQFTFFESVLISVIVILYNVLGTLAVCLHPGYIFTTKWKLLTVSFIIAYLAKYMIEYYLRENIDYNLNIFGDNLTVSLRSMIISGAFELVVWFIYQAYQILAKPDQMQLVSKVSIEWI